MKLYLAAVATHPTYATILAQVLQERRLQPLWGGEI